MKSRWIILFCGIVWLTACDSPEKPSDEATLAEPEPAPLVSLIEAENCEILGETAGDPKASGGVLVKGAAGDSALLLRCDIPVAGNPLSVWIRRKGGAFQINTTSAGDDGEAVVCNEYEENFAWDFLGEISPGEETRQLVVSGSDPKDGSVMIDCILFSEGTPGKMDDLLTPLPPIEIDTARTSGDFRNASALWGMNLSSGSDPLSLADPGYIENVSYLAPHLVRVHNPERPVDSEESRHGLLDFASRSWDEQKVRMAVVGLLELENVGDMIINIPNWPAWMDADEDGFLDDDKAAEYVDLVGRFAEIVWEFPGASERISFEITSGMDGLYHENPVAAKEPHRIAQFARVYIQCSLRIRQVAPGARVGGPSVGNAGNTAFHEQFIALTAPELDFYSMRLTGGRDLKSVAAAVESVDSVKAILAKNSKGRAIPVFVSEHCGETDDARIALGSGAVWESWFLISLFSAGADSAAAWNENGGIHGKFSPEGERRPAAHLYHLLNTEFAGSVACLQTDEPEDIAALSTEAGDRLLISHRGTRGRKIILPEGNWTGWMLGAGMDALQETTVDGETYLPGISLLYLEK